jgi:Sec-independent protein secretion pathway component TatC
VIILDGVVPTDSSQHVMDHLAEASKRIQRLVFAFLLVAIIWAFVIDDMFAWWLARIPLAEGAGSLTIYSPYAWLDTKWTAVGLLAIWTTLPWAALELWKFAEPGLLQREKAWLSTMISTGILGGSVLVIWGWGWGFPRLVEMANSAGMIEGVGAHYDVVSLFAMALALTWFVLLLFLQSLGLTVGRGLDLITEDPLDSLRLRLHFVAITILYIVTPPAFQGLFLAAALTLIFGTEFIASLSPLASRTRGRNSQTIFDSEGGERRVLMVDCACVDVCPRLQQSQLGTNIGMMVANAICLNPDEVGHLCERVSSEQITDVVISGCDGSPTPGNMKHSLEAMNCSLSGLDRLSTTIHGDSATPEYIDLANRIDLARASRPWSESAQSRAQLKVIQEQDLPANLISSSTGIQPWGLRLKENDIWVNNGIKLSDQIDIQMID